MFRASRSGDDASSRVLNSLQLVEIRGRRAVKHRVAVVESPVDHWAGDRLCSVGWDVLPNVMQRPQVEVGRLANAVDMFIERQSVINSYSQTSDASRKLDADALKVECAWRTFCSLSRASADDDGLCLVWIHRQTIEVEPMLHSSKAVRQQSVYIQLSADNIDTKMPHKAPQHRKA